MHAPLKKALLQYLIIILGNGILAFGLYNVHSQSKITEGGVLGMTLLLQHWFHISPRISNPIFDITCFAMGYQHLGKAFAKYSLVATVSFSLWYYLYEKAPPMLPDLNNAPLLAAVIGGLSIGIGAGLCVRIGGACGGDDALAMVFSKISHLPISVAYLSMDLIVLSLSITYLPLSRIFYSAISVTCSSLTIGLIQKTRTKDKSK